MTKDLNLQSKDDYRESLVLLLKAINSIFKTLYDLMILGLIGMSLQLTSLLIGSWLMAMKAEYHKYQEQQRLISQTKSIRVSYVDTPIEQLSSGPLRDYRIVEKLLRDSKLVT